MDGKLLARIGAIVFVAIAITVAAIEATRPPPSPTRPNMGAREAATSEDPLRAALAHCQRIGSAAQDDPICLRAWAESRRRFFARDRGEADNSFEADLADIHPSRPPMSEAGER